MSPVFQGLCRSHGLEKKEAGVEMESVEMNVSLRGVTLPGRGT